jgi:hypothetical protein
VASGCGPSPAGISPKVEKTLNGLIAERAFDAVVPAGWRLTSINTSQTQIELAFADAGGASHSVELQLEWSWRRTIGRGRHFHFRMGQGTGAPGETQALARAATLVDENVPQEALIFPPPRVYLPQVSRGRALLAVDVLLASILALALHRRRRDEKSAEAREP